MSCQSAPACETRPESGTCLSPGVPCSLPRKGPHEMPLVPFFIGFFEFGQGHRGPMIPYCPGAP
ncbi:unnamed protein product, partial [Staurois parvus]